MFSRRTAIAKAAHPIGSDVVLQIERGDTTTYARYDDGEETYYAVDEYPGLIEAERRLGHADVVAAIEEADNVGHKDEGYYHCVQCPSDRPEEPHDR